MSALNHDEATKKFVKAERRRKRTWSPISSKPVHFFSISQIALGRLMSIHLPHHRRPINLMFLVPFHFHGDCSSSLSNLLHWKLSFQILPIPYFRKNVKKITSIQVNSSRIWSSCGADWTKLENVMKVVHVS